MARSTPSYNLVFETSNINFEKSKHVQCIQDHFFNYSLNIILPGCSEIPSSIREVLKPQAFYRVSDVPLSALISPEFVSAFVKGGHLYMLSADTRIDEHDCVSLTPNGKLHLHLTKDTYERLGLQGKPSKYNTKTCKKFTVTVDMKEKCFQPGKKFYQRVLWCFTDRLQLRFDFLVTWVPPKDTDISAISIGSYFESLDHETVRCKLKYSSRLLQELQVPSICSSKPHDQESDFYEWLGAMSCDIDCSEGCADSYTNTLCCPEPSEMHDRCVTCRYRGLLSTDGLLEIMTIIRDHLKKQEMTWAAMTVQGFQDSPVTWRDHEHGFLASGDHSYTFILFRNGDYWLYKAFSSHDIIS